MKTTVYCHSLRRGILYDFREREGSGTYARLPVWESLVLPLVASAVLICLILDLEEWS